MEPDGSHSIYKNPKFFRSLKQISLFQETKMFQDLI